MRGLKKRSKCLSGIKKILETGGEVKVEEAERNVEKKPFVEVNGVKYYINKKLGEGGFGIAYLTSREGKQYVVKMIKRTKRTKKSMMNDKIEIDVLEYIKSPATCKKYLTCLVAAETKPEEPLKIVMDYIPGYQDMFDLIEEKKLTLLQKLYIIRDLILGLKVLHSSGVVHRDIKPENIMATTKPKDGESYARYIDFGLACTKTGSRLATTDCYRRYVGTTIFMAPEVVRKTELGFRQWKKADIWSLGITVYVLLERQLPWRANTGTALRNEVATGILYYPLKYKKAVHLIWQLLDDRLLDTTYIDRLIHKADKRLL